MQEAVKPHLQRKAAQSTGKQNAPIRRSSRGIFVGLQETTWQVKKMKTLEFKIYPTIAQSQRIDAWMRSLKYVWNRGVMLIEEFNRFNAYHKPGKQTYPACPTTTYNHKKGTFPSCPIGWIVNDQIQYIERKGKEAIAIYPVRVQKDSHAVTQLNFFGLLASFTHKEHLDKEWLTDVPSKFIAGCVKSLAESWLAFTKQKGRKPPKYKGKNDKIVTLVHNNSKDVGVKGDSINIPKLGYIKVKGFSARWNPSTPFCPLKIIKYPSGYYLQVTGEVPEKPRRKNKKAIAGFDPGILAFVTDDLGRAIAPPQYLEKSLVQLAKLQRKAARQRLHADNQGKKQKDCKNLQKTYTRIARIHEKSRRQRRAFNHFQSTKFVDQFATIYIEDTSLKNMITKPEPRKREDAEGYEPNGRRNKRNLNRRLADAGIGQFYTMLETKGEVRGTDIVRVPAPDTSRECSVCGHIDEKSVKPKSTFCCTNCGRKMNVDHNAAIIIKRRGIGLQSV